MVPSNEKLAENRAENKPDGREILIDIKGKIIGAESPEKRRLVMRETFQSLKRSQLDIASQQLKTSKNLPVAFTTVEQQEMLEEIAHARTRLNELGQDLEVWYKPDTWSPDTKQRMVALGWGAGVGIGVIALALLWRATRKKTAEVAKATGEKVGWLWGKIKWGIALGAAGVLGYIGFRSYQEFMKLTALRNQLDTVTKKALAATGKAKEALDNEVKNLKAAIATLETKGAQALAEQKEKIPGKEKETVQETGHNAVAAVKEAGQDAVAAAQDKTQKIIDDPRTKEIVDKTKEMTKERLIAKVILAQSAQEWADLGVEAKENQIIGLLGNNGAKTMNELENAPDFPFAIPEKTEDKPNRIQSGTIVLDYCQRSRTAVQEKIIHDRNCTPSEAETIIGTLPLIQYLEYALRGSSEYIKTMEELSKIPRSLEEFSAGLQKMPFKHILNGEAVKATLLHVMSEIRPEDIGISQEELETIDVTSVLMAALSLDQGDLLSKQKELRGKKEASPEERILLGILDRIAADTNTTHRVMLPLFHGVFPDSDPTKTPEQQVRTYLRERMTPAEALRFYMYHRMLSQGNALVLPLMQMEVIRFIARHDNSVFRGSKKYEAIAGMTGDLITNGGQKIVDEWRALGLPDLKIELTDGEKKAITLMGTHLALAPTAGLKESFLAFWGTYGKYPTLFTGAAFGAGALQVAATRAPFMKYLHPSFTDPTAFSKLLKTLPNTAGALDIPTRIASSLRSMRPFSYLVYTQTEMTEAQHAYHMIFDEGIQKMPKKDTATKLLRHCLANPRMASRWRTLATELDSFDTRIADEARKLAAVSGSRLRGALSALRLPFTLKSGGLIQSVVTLPARAAAVAIDRPLMKGAELTKRAYDTIKASPHLPEIMKKLKIAPEAFLSALHTINFPPQLAALFAKSKGGMYMLVHAFAKGGSAGLNYLAKLGNLAPAAKLLARPAGAIGLGTFFYLMEKSVIDEQIKNTDSPELKELYEARKNAEAAFAIGTTGSALALRYGGKALLGGALLPVTIAAEATYFIASPIKRSFDEATIEWMKSDKDMLKDTPGQLLGKLSDIDIGKQRYKDQNAARGDSVFGGSLLEQVTGLGNGQARYEQVERANTGQRAKITRAYLANTSEIVTGDKEKVARALMAQEQYISSATDNTFGTVNTEGYYNAQDHAELKEVSRTLQESGESGYLHLLSLNGLGQIEQGDEFDLREYNDLPPKGGNAKGISRGKVLLSYRQQKRAMALASSFLIGEMKTGSANVDREQEAILAHRMITDIRHDLSRADARVQSAEIDRWEWTGGKEETRGRMRFALSTELKKMLAEESKTLRTHPNAGLPEINASIAKLQLFLAQDMAVFAKLAEQPDVLSGFTAFSASERPSTALTDWKVLMQELNPPAGATNAPMGLAA